MEPVRIALQRRFGVPAEQIAMVFAPYRVCPLGAHIDHQLGRVTAMALDRGVELAFAPSRSRKVEAASLSFPGEVLFTLDEVPDKQPGDWGNYLRGAVRALARRRPLAQGILAVSDGRLSGGGLSSSAAAGVAFLLALEAANGVQMTAEDNILLDQEIENGYLGLKNGILDQSAILLSKQRQLTVIDCGTLKHQRIVPGQSMPAFKILVAMSALTQSLVSTDYNRRVEECGEAARQLLEAAGRQQDEPRLGRVSAGEYEAFRGRLHGAPARRAAHFFSEMERVSQGIDAWTRGDLGQFGQLITASGESSIRNYECGCPPLIDLYRLLIATPGVLGARFSGAGFRGCCIALVDARAAQDAADAVSRDYNRLHPDLAENAGVLICDTGDGARVVGAA